MIDFKRSAESMSCGIKLPKTLRVAEDVYGPCRCGSGLKYKFCCHPSNVKRPEQLKTAKEQQQDHDEPDPIAEQAEQIFKTVKQLFDESEAIIGVTYDENAEPGKRLYEREDFNIRIAQAGRRLYLDMLNNGGQLPGKLDCADAGAFYTAGMNEQTKAVFYMCIYEACCEASAQFRMKGMMNGKLRKAADNPR